MVSRIEQIQKINEEKMKIMQPSNERRKQIPRTWKRSNEKEKGEESWDRRFGEIKNFIEKNKRLPEIHSGNVNEKMYVMQLRNMQARLRNKKLSNKQENQLEQLLLPYKSLSTNYDKERLKHFESMIETISSLMEEKDRKISYANIEERNLYVFLNKQKHKLKKGKLSEERKEILTKFLNKHKHQFNQ